MNWTVNSVAILIDNFNKILVQVYCSHYLVFLCYLEKVLMHVHQLWGRTGHLETIIEEKERSSLAMGRRGIGSGWIKTAKRARIINDPCSLL